jgi:hypothetical protein
LTSAESRLTTNEADIDALEAIDAGNRLTSAEIRLTTNEADIDAL